MDESNKGPVVTGNECGCRMNVIAVVNDLERRYARRAEDFRALRGMLPREMSKAQDEALFNILMMVRMP